MDEEHAEDGFLRKRFDRFPRAERANLQSHFHEEAVTGLPPVVQEDALVFRVPALERENGIVVSLARKPLVDARVPDPFPDLLRPEPAEEKVFRVDARKFEKKLPFGGRDFLSSSSCPAGAETTGAGAGENPEAILFCSWDAQCITGRKIRVDTGGTKGILYLFSRERCR